MIPIESVLLELEDSLEVEGYTKGTPLFDRKMRERKVERCRELKRLGTCGECPVHEECNIRLQYLRDL